MNRIAVSICASLLALFLVCVAPAPAQAQSHDPAHPTPLAPGINKGNVDNFKDGPNYYYFYAGPGRVDIRQAFHEMGVFGNPLRQSLSFDLSDEKGKVYDHESVTSQGNLAEVKNYGTFATRQRALLTITAQPATIRMGGYYEFEVTGVVFFDGKAGSSAGVKPEDTSLTSTQKNGPVSLTSGPTTLTSGTTTLTSGPVALTSGKPVTLVYPGQPLTVLETAHELRIRLAADVLFDFNKADIRPDAIPVLRQAASDLKAAKPHGAIMVEGFTDAKGTSALNLRLSQERADAVETWLVQNAGFSVSAFSPRGYGAARPVAPNQKPNGQDDPAGRQLNRRVELVATR